jgi:hypothetical protein
LARPLESQPPAAPAFARAGQSLVRPRGPPAPLERCLLRRRPAQRRVEAALVRPTRRIFVLIWPGASCLRRAAACMTYGLPSAVCLRRCFPFARLMPPLRSHDPECRDFASPGMPLPPDVRAACAPPAPSQPPAEAADVPAFSSSAGGLPARGHECARQAAEAAPEALDAAEAEAARRAKEAEEDQIMLAALLEVEARSAAAGMAAQGRTDPPFAGDGCQAAG